MSIEERFPFTTVEDSIIEKDWATGSREHTDISDFVIRFANGKYTAEYVTLRYAPAWWKIIDEVLVNAIDHFIRCLDTAHPVTKITMQFDRDGRVRIFNDGPGIEVVKHTTASEKLGREIYLPTLVFSVPFQGSNRVKPPDSITGGTNGLGGKLMVMMSVDAIAETVHGHTYFLQRWRERKTIEDPPVIIDLRAPNTLPKEKTIPHTTLSFMPDYFGLFGYTEFTEDIYNQLNDVLRTRMWYAAAYIGYTLMINDGMRARGKKSMIPPFTISYNNEPIACRSMEDIARVIFPGEPIYAQIIAPAITEPAPTSGRTTLAHYRYPWEVCVVNVNSSKFIRPHVSNVNGIMVGEGKHIAKIANALCAGVETLISKQLGDKNVKFSNSQVLNNVFIFANTKIPNPNWTGQRKDVMGTDIRNFVNYNLDAKLVATVGRDLKDIILQSIFARIKGKKAKKAKIAYDKYTPAQLASTKDAALCTLIPCEGDSAQKQVELGLTNTIGLQRYGTISTGGVIMNIRRECEYISVGSGQRLNMSDRMKKNPFIQAFLEACGLDPDYRYDMPSAVSDELRGAMPIIANIVKIKPLRTDSADVALYKRKIADLNYGCIAMCVDQDLDGKGNILGLILNMFDTLWPALYACEFVKWFETPIIRAYPRMGSQVLSFYSQIEYDDWVRTHDITKYEPKYYKGLGTHSKEETIHMFRNFTAHLVTIYADAKSHDLFEVYFGDNPQKRKHALAQPPRVFTEDELRQQRATMRMSCSELLESATDEYQRDNLDRKLDHVIDGQNQAGRKILDGVLKICRQGREIKVEKLMGPISERENYHHGGASLCESIQGKAYVAVGGKQLPILIPCSNLGSRREGGKDAAAPRYTDVMLNHRLTQLLFPSEDYWMLEFNFEEGKRGEPKHFVPLLPLVICESTEIPAHGWKLKLWARDVNDVIKNIHRLIDWDDNAPLLDMRPDRGGTSFKWTGEFRYIRGELYSFGRYHYEQSTNTIVITELPLRTWTDGYIVLMKKKAVTDPNIIEDIDQSGSNDTVVCIRIELKPGALDRLEHMGDGMYADGVEEYFQLRDRMDNHINLMDPIGRVLEFQDYKQVMYHWFAARKDLYRQRIERMRVVLELEVIRAENIIRYIEMSPKLKMAGRTDADMITALEGHNFIKINRARLNAPKFTPTANLRNVVLGLMADACPEDDTDDVDSDDADRKPSKPNKSVEASYDYLLDLTDRAKSTEGLARARKELATIHQKITDLDTMAAKGRFPGAFMFKEELTKLEKVIQEGMKTDWKFKNANRFKFQ